MGATLTGGGATFRVWAPGADRVYLALDPSGGYQPRPGDQLVCDPVSGHWSGFFPGITDGTRYRFFVAGPGGSGLKRDPWARELDLGGYPECDCIVRDPASYPWHDQGFTPPAFSDLIVYQLHVGVFYARDGQGHDLRPERPARFLDVLDRVEYLADLGVSAIQPLPVAEFPGEWSLGYNGTDLFSPERDYSVPPGELPACLGKINALLAKRNCPGLELGQLTGQVNQLKAMIDICHLYGVAVLADVVYNHAGGNLDPQSIDYFDFPATPARITASTSPPAAGPAAGCSPSSGREYRNFSPATPRCSSASTTRTASGSTRSRSLTRWAAGQCASSSPGPCGRLSRPPR